MPYDAWLFLFHISDFTFQIFFMATAFLGLGSNLGDRLAHLRGAVAALRAQPHMCVAACSPVYETAALAAPGVAPGGAYLNAVVKLVLRPSPHDLLMLGQRLERAAGREAPEVRATWAPRPLDVDVLLYRMGWGDWRSEEPDLTLPHPGVRDRWFVLQPLLDLGVHEVSGQSLVDLLAALPAEVTGVRVAQKL